MKKLFDSKLFKILLVFYTSVSLVSLLKISYLKINNFGYEYNTWPEILLELILLDWLIIIVFMAVIAMTTKYMLLKQISWKVIFGFHAILSILFGFIIYFLSSTVYFLSGQIKLNEIDVSDHFAGIISVIDMNFLIYIAMVSIVYSYYYFDQIQKTKLEKAQISAQLANVKLNILKYKVHPHFLFNTLNSISSLIDSNTKLAQDTIADFGDLLRYLTNLKDTNLIAIEEEILICKKYLDIMLLRFSDNLNVKCKVEPALKHHKIPSLILLPIIENSIKHGYSYNHTSLEIELSIYASKNNIVIKIDNNGASLGKKINYGTGLTNTVDRLKILYKNNFNFTMKNKKNKNGIATIIEIPKNNINQKQFLN